MQQGEGGFVKDYRSKLGWEWWTDIHTAHLWEYICLRVNYEPSRFRGMEIGRGEMLESIGTMAARTGLTTQNVRTALEHLKRTGEITCKVTRYGLLIKALKYAFFQGDDAQGNTQTNTEVTSQLTRKSQGTNTEVTTYKEIKKERRKRNREERGASAPTLPEIREFVMEEGLTIDPDRFFNFYEGQDWKTSAGNPIGDWRAKARAWQSTEKQRRTEELPDFYNADPVRDPDPQLATSEEIEQVRAMLLKGKGEKFR